MCVYKLLILEKKYKIISKILYLNSMKNKINLQKIYFKNKKLLNSVTEIFEFVNFFNKKINKIIKI